MGFDVARFEGDVDEELICPICSGVLEEPLQAPLCEHAFCSQCIHQWLVRQQTCPVDRNTITPNQLKPVPRILRNLLCRLFIHCDNASFGCESVLKLDLLDVHLTDCEFNPKRPVPCELGCGITIPKDELKNHHCVRELRNFVQQQQTKILELTKVQAEQKQKIEENRQEIQQLKEYVRALRTSSSQLRDVVGDVETDEVVRWGASLSPARVTRWGGMISTPDAVLQAIIKRALIDNHCPSHIVNELMENAHERHWPPGLSTLETRQLHRREYENFVTKRIPGKQAVVAMSCENQHMAENMMQEPGLVMIFAHGVE